MSKIGEGISRTQQQERRERIATAVLAGMVANPDSPLQCQIAAEGALKQADALIAELDK